MLQWITPEDALLGKRCKRLLIEKEHDEQRSLLNRQMEAEHDRFREFVFSLFSGDRSRVAEADGDAAVAVTAELLAGEEPPRNIVDPAFRWERFVVRPDLIRYSSKDEGWRVYLVRPATGVRGNYIDEAAMTLLVVRRRGFPVASVKLIYLDKSYIREKELNPGALLKESELTRRGEKLQRHALKLLRESEELFYGGEELSPAYRCEMPGPCSLCREEMGRLPRHNVLTLARGGRQARELYLRGVASIFDLPSTYKPTRRQEIQIAAVRDNRTHVDSERLHSFLERLIFPRLYLDFEAFNTAIPPLPGVAPFEHIPYLFSVHRQESSEAEVVNGTFVMEPGKDERVGMFRELLKWSSGIGSLVVFSAAFESAMVRQLARVSNAPDRGEELVSSIVDLLEPFNEFALYHPEQLGKVSMKRIVPIFTEESYDDLAVQDGLEANVAYGELFARSRTEGNADTDYPQPAGSEERDAVLERLKAYCVQDTSGMVRLVDRLEKLLGG